MFTKRLLRTLALLTAVLLLASACANANQADDTVSAEDDTVSTEEGTPVADDRPFEGQTLRVANFGGSWNDAVRDTTGVRFEEETGAQVEYIEGNPPEHAAKLYATVGQEVPFDVIYTDGKVQTDLVKEGVLLEIDPEAVPTAEEIAESFPPINPGFSPGNNLFFTGIAYNTEKFEELGLDPPTSWDALWQEELAGRVAVPDISTVMGMPVTMAAAAVATGGDLMDVEAGVLKLAELDLYSLYSASGDMQNDFSTGDIWIAAGADGRAWQLADEGLPIDFVVPELPGVGERGWAEVGYTDIVKGTEVEELAKVWMRIAHEPESMVEIMKLTGFAPPLEEALLQVFEEDPVWKERHPSASEWKEIMVADWNEVSPLEAQTIDLFNRHLGG
ncbi:MAG: extracellular solute-binding protein [Actinobacteria bacterium]|nr:extracellular solute-binding protein [Actinomycetota bacterium]